MKVLAIIALALWAGCALQVKSHNDVDPHWAAVTILTTFAELVWVIA